MATPPDNVLQFDRFLLDRGQRVLIRDGEIVRLTPKAFDLLELLVSRPGEVIGKTELIERIWPDTIASDTNLSKLVFMIRKELGDAPDGREYIETIPKRGYRFVEASSRDAAPQPPPRRRRIEIVIGLAVAIAVVGAGAFFWYARAKAPRRERVYLMVMPFTPVMGGDESLAAGISEFVTARLATIHGISVLPAMMAGSTSNADPRALGRRLGADLVLLGRVQRKGDQIGVVFRLMSVDGKRQVGDSFMLASTDIFDLEERVAGSVATLLEVDRTLRRSADRALATPERQQAYLRALGILSRFAHDSRIDDAIALLEPLASGKPQSPLVMAELGRAHLLRFKLYGERKDLDIAQSFAASAGAIAGGEARVHALRGKIARARGDFRTAADELRAALALEPDANDVLLDLASVYGAMGLSEKAEETYERVIRIHPLCAVCFNAYGMFYKKAGRLENAVTMHRRAIALDDDSSQFHSDLAVSLMLLGRFRESIVSLTKAATISRNNEVLSNLGYAEYLVGDYQAAAQHFLEGTERAPDDYLVWGNLGDALRCLPSRKSDADHAFDRAIAGARAALQVNPRDPLMHAHLAEYLAKRGNAAAARKEIDIALASGPGSQDEADILFSAAAVAAVQGEKSAAAELLRRAASAGMSPTLFSADPQFASLR
jgi:DNA-binding winged helix-turn-helix (wHTH) protein/tetratricopeptide (TPR) repeat protein/TolB-like protein